MDVFLDNYNDWIKLSKSYVGDFYAQDIVNEAYIKLENKKNLTRSYIFLTIRSLCIDFLRSRNKLKKCSLFEIEQKANVEVQKKQAYDILINKIEKEMRSWYWYDAKLFSLYKDTPMSLRKISKETGISIVSIFHTIKMCKKIIKDKFAEDYKNFADGNYELIQE